MFVMKVLVNAARKNYESDNLRFVRSLLVVSGECFEENVMI